MERVAARGGADVIDGVSGRVPVMARASVLVAVRVVVGVCGGDWKTGRASASPGIVQIMAADSPVRTSTDIRRRVGMADLKCNIDPHGWRTRLRNATLSLRSTRSIRASREDYT
jgi:hypothetical protein